MYESLGTLQYIDLYKRVYVLLQKCLCERCSLKITWGNTGGFCMNKLYICVALLMAASLQGQLHAETSMKSRMAAVAAAATAKKTEWRNGLTQSMRRVRSGNQLVLPNATQEQSAADSQDVQIQPIMNEYRYNQAGEQEYTVADIQAADVEWVHATLKPIFFTRVARMITPTALDTAVFEQCLDAFTLEECLTLARMKSPLLYASNALLVLAQKEAYAELFEYLYQQLPDALTAKIFVRYVLMVRGRLAILDMPEYIAVCKQFLSVFAPAEAFTPLQNQETIEALVASNEINDLLLLKALVTPESVGVAGVRRIVPFMPHIVAVLSAKLPQTKEAFTALSLEQKRAAALALVIIITIGKDNEVVPDIYPWVAIFTQQVAARLYDVCIAAPILLKHEEIMRLGLPESVGKHVGKLRFVPRNLAINKIVAVMKIEEQKQAARNASQ